MAWQDDIQENMKRGIMEMLVLHLLSLEDMYGYQIKQEIEARSNGAITLKEGSLYGPLYRMIEKKFVTERQEFVGQRRFRNYYHLEPLGREYLNVIRAEYENISNGTKLILDGSSGKKNEE